jgi:hypothetical protein
MASQAGWGRLAEDIRTAGFDVKVSTNPRGQVLSDGPDTYSISFQVRGEAGEFLGCVDVSDKHGRMGKWYGWTVTAEGPDSITIGRPTYAVTGRPEIVAHFAAVVATLARRAA